MRTGFHVKSIKLDVFKYVNMHKHVSYVEKFQNGTSNKYVGGYTQVEMQFIQEIC